MDNATSIKKALDHVERNLHGELTIEDLAYVSGFSLSHFHSLFHRTTGCTPAEYIRRRRLSCAAIDLALSRRRILDIALDYQFQSQAVFTRAFRQYFGVTPRTFRHRRAVLPVRPRFHLAPLRPAGWSCRTSRGSASTRGAIRDQEPHLGFAEASVRRKVAAIIRRARDLDEEAALHLDHALSTTRER